jgi:phosphoribosylaminoimidazole-succinocarboxamide synthase
MEALWQSELPGLPPPRRGKVRDVYDLGETLLIVASDRLSAYDYVLRPGIPGKGKVLNQLSNFWFGRLSSLIPNHLLATDPADFPAALAPFRDALRGRAVLARKADVVPFECVARGFLAGGGYREYVKTGTVSGIPLPPGLQRASQLPEPIFTPATKATEGHDENVSFETVAGAVGAGLTATLREITLELYQAGASHAASRNLILADTKFELGHALRPDGKAGELLLVDEVMTPDSSRYWDIANWRPGEEPDSFDKQYVRNWLSDNGLRGEAAELPPGVVEQTRSRYVEAYERLTGASFDDYLRAV